MFLWAGSKGTQGSGSERRTIYQKIREYDVLEKRRTVTALKAGEDRAILLGLGMILFSAMMYFVLPFHWNNPGGFHTSSLVRKGAWFALKIANMKTVRRTPVSAVLNPRLPEGGGLSSVAPI
uniref:Calcium-activated potassium channel subunit beta-2 n=1 Tax=Sinocyclocheilus grahami TaxID=75366 RepID=A0A672PXB4_SINGR